MNSRVKQCVVFCPELLGDDILKDTIILNEIITSFIKVIIKDDKTLHKAITQQDKITLYKIFHNFYGASANIGYQKFAAICRDLAYISKVKNWNTDKVNQLFNIYEVELSKMKNHIRDNLQIKF